MNSLGWDILCRSTGVSYKIQITWYNPHHPVFYPNKPGKCRVAFDCRKQWGVVERRTAKEPDLLTGLIGIQQVPVVADVEKMFHHVRVRPSDGPAFWFIWRDPGTIHPPDIYQMGCFISAIKTNRSLSLWIEVYWVLNNTLVFNFQFKIKFRRPHFCSKLPQFSYILGALGMKI